MAKSEKMHPPTPITINVPSALTPIMQAFHVESDEAIRSFILEACKAIYGRKEEKTEFDIFDPKDRIISTAELDGITAMIRSISPKDSMETIYAAQIVVSHMLGISKLSCNYAEDQKLGLKMLKFCNEAMQQLERKRCGGNQNITVNHNYNGTGNNLSQTTFKGAENAS